jgi:hypothetical protein
MKKIILLVFISLMFSNIGFAEMSLIEQTKVKDYQISTVCIDGHKFVAFDRMHKDGVQVWFSFGIKYQDTNLYQRIVENI